MMLELSSVLIALSLHSLSHFIDFPASLSLLCISYLVVVSCSFITNKDPSMWGVVIQQSVHGNVSRRFRLAYPCKVFCLYALCLYAFTRWYIVIKSCDSFRGGFKVIGQAILLKKLLSKFHDVIRLTYVYKFRQEISFYTWWLKEIAEEIWHNFQRQSGLMLSLCRPCFRTYVRMHACVYEFTFVTCVYVIFRYNHCLFTSLYFSEHQNPMVNSKTAIKL